MSSKDTTSNEDSDSTDSSLNESSHESQSSKSTHSHSDAQSASSSSHEESKSQPKSKASPPAKPLNTSSDHSTASKDSSDEESSEETSSRKTQSSQEVTKPTQVQPPSTSSEPQGMFKDPPDFSVTQDVLDEANSKPIDEFGFIIKRTPTPEEERLNKAYQKKELEREKKWETMMSKHNWPKILSNRRKYRKVKTRAIKGIPNKCRAKAWRLILEANNKHKLEEVENSVQRFYDQEVPAVDHTIRVDIPRTLPQVPQFLQADTRLNLYRILRAYNNSDNTLGYFQGMNFHAAIFLLYMKDSDEAFSSLYNLMKGEKHRLRDLFADGFKGLQQLNKVWMVCLERHFKAVHTKLIRLDIDPMLYTPSWFLCAFLDMDFPAPLLMRIVDRLVVFGSRQLLSLGLAIIDLNESKLADPKAQMEIVLPILQNPTTQPTMKDWRAIVRFWDKHYIKDKEYEALCRKAGIEKIP